MSASTSPGRNARPWADLLEDLELWARWRAALVAGVPGNTGTMLYEPREIEPPPKIDARMQSAFESRMLDLDRAIAALKQTQPLLALVFEAEHEHAWPLAARVRHARCPQRTYYGRREMVYRCLTDLRKPRKTGVPK